MAKKQKVDQNISCFVFLSKSQKRFQGSYESIQKHTSDMTKRITFKVHIGIYIEGKAIEDF
jgi:hypothetical protein